MKEACYRLGEYKIIESDTGQLMWEAHFGFGEFQRGRCFRKGNILFIGSTDNRRNGFLKGEFLDDLKKYPRWGKTNILGNIADVHHCKSGRDLTKEDMMLWALGRSLEKGVEIHRAAKKDFSNSALTENVTENAVFRLRQYQIIIRTDGQIISRTYTGSNAVSSSSCFILENILFIGPQQKEPSSFTKSQFFASLRQLPVWDQTAYFCKRFSLHVCEPGNEVKEDLNKPHYQTGKTKKYGAGNEHKNNPGTGSPKGAYRSTFFLKLSAVLGSFVDFSERRNGYVRLSHLRFIKSNLLKISTVLRESGIPILKKIFRAVALIFYIFASLFVFMAGHLRKLHKRWHDIKK